MKTYTTLILALLLPVLAFSQAEIQFNGFVDTYHAIQIKKPNKFMSSRTRFRGELQKYYENSSIFVSFNLNQNSILKDRNGFELREAYLDYSEDNWGFRLGRQLIIWGAADGLRITDLVSPMDMTEFLARDYDDIRMPVEALKFNYFFDEIRCEFVFVPVFKGFILPNNPKNPWAIPMPIIPNMKVVMLQDNKPEFKLKNSEFGGRIVFNLSGIDFSFSALQTFNKIPLLSKYIKSDSLLIRPEYKRFTFLGGDFAKPLGEFVIRGEVAFNINKRLITKQTPTVLQKHNTINALLGIDWYAPNEWMIALQMNNELVMDHKNELEQRENTTLLTFNVQKQLLNNTLKLSDFIYVDLNNSGFFNRFSLDYSLSDEIHLLMGYDHFEGDSGMFGNYKDNSEIWIKAKYSF
ncbi:MAG: hypothetical protein CR986_00030 [Ignavibacteriae bacterium]|nr:MAG: hypothetical protein CR986_00030 [Ignavibacteriota bacterium]